jgi:PTH1 family peptidyl-tRNA hydrolase
VKLIVGLGNPGHTYHDTRHNVGFAVIQRLAERRGVDIRERIVGPDGRPAGVYGDDRHGRDTVRLLMPLTMMNESGQALRGAAVGPQEFLIVCDDVNLPLGTLRLRPVGSAGGHHGLISCLEALGTEEIPRLRIGVGTEPLPRDLTEFVLSPFRSDERPAIRRAVEQAADACETWAAEGLEMAMNRYNKQDTGFRTQDT